MAVVYKPDAPTRSERHPDKSITLSPNAAALLDSVMLRADRRYLDTGTASLLRGIIEETMKDDVGFETWT